MNRKLSFCCSILLAAAIFGAMTGCVGPSNGSAVKDFDIAVTEQESDQIKVFDPREADWSKKSALKWSWSRLPDPQMDSKA
ncbi:hypothetical protein [Paenibacillus nasutitermitis]|uniref:Uncharacterized protein n=1 Tax=Paenibacillus nasutitermitis TaxID=1652958 RepID=A0A917E409_9BACL|nr:hypothetical protein [Paenibacillus nasutitermitis]GGE02681.1 hypothetical protein GCM10010911_72170 [Paenibacillus nasutitermitis]